MLESIAMTSIEIAATCFFLMFAIAGIVSVVAIPVMLIVWAFELWRMS